MYKCNYCGCIYDVSESQYKDMVTELKTGNPVSKTVVMCPVCYKHKLTVILEPDYWCDGYQQMIREFDDSLELYIGVKDVHYSPV